MTAAASTTPRTGSAGRWGVLTGALVVAGLGLGGAAVAMAATSGGGPAEAAVAPSASPPAATRPTPTPAPSATAGATADSLGIAGLADPAWVDAVATAAGVPPVAVAAYAGAAIRLAEERPGCGLGWNTLAAIGEVESAHGTAGGSALDAHGTAVPPVVGPALDGRGGVAAIRDTDGGALDGDPTWDRAVGPMQFIPASWATWAADGDGDGRTDPQNITDAALAAARYLCESGDLTDPGTWIAAIDGYNAGAPYNARIADAADRFAALG